MPGESSRKFSRKVKLTYDIYFKSKRRRDEDNYYPKYITDVVKDFYLRDDSSDYCEQKVVLHNGMLYSGAAYYTESDGTLITIEEII